MTEELKPFPMFPRCLKQDFRKPYLNIRVRGTSIEEVDFVTGNARLWRHLFVDIKKLRALHGKELPEVDVDDLRFFRDQYFKRDDEVFYAVPRAGQDGTTIRLFAVVAGPPVLPRVVRLVVDGGDPDVPRVLPADPPAEAPSLDGAGTDGDAPAAGEGTVHG